MKDTLPLASKQTWAVPTASLGKVEVGSDLKRRAVRGGAITVVAQVCKVGVEFGSTAILARILLPGDFGLVAMVTAVVGFMALFKDMGLSMATIQRENVTHEEVNSLFWFNVAFSAGLAVLIAVSSPALAWFYKEPRLVAVSIWLGSGFVMSGLTIQHQALLRRNMDFRRVAIAEIAAGAVAAFAGVGAAFLGMGYWSLVVKTLVSGLLNMVLVWFFSSWRPTRPAWHSGARSMLAFGGYLTAFDVLNYFARNLGGILIGRYWGATQLGFYSNAFKMLVFPTQQITAPIAAVGIPTLSRLQDQPERFASYFVKAVSLIAFLSLPLVAFIFLMASELIRLLLGPKWGETVPIFRYLAIAMFVQPIVSPTGWLYIALGRTRRFFFWGLMGCTVMALSFVIGLPYGAKGMALTYSIGAWLIAFPALWFATQGTKISIAATLWATSKPLIGVVPAVTIAYMVKGVVPESWSVVPCLTVASLVFGSTYCLVMWRLGELKVHLDNIIPAFRPQPVVPEKNG